MLISIEPRLVIVLCAQFQISTKHMSFWYLFLTSNHSAYDLNISG